MQYWRCTVSQTVGVSDPKDHGGGRKEGDRGNAPELFMTTPFLPLENALFENRD